MYNSDVADLREIPNAPDIIKAAYTIKFEYVKRLLEDGANVNAVDDRDNLTCLHIACLYNYEELADIILAHDATHHDVDFSALSKHSQRMAWMYAADSGFSALAKKVHRAGLEAEKYRNRRKPSAGPRP